MALHTRRNWFDTASLGFPTVEAAALRDYLPGGRLGDALVRVPGDRYVRLEQALRGAAIVHSQDLGFWYSMQAARLRERLGYKLVLTVWETLPFLDAYRNVRTRRYRRLVLAQTDLFLAATERARAALELEGAPADRIRVVAPGVDSALFRAPAAQEAPSHHVVVSPGRLVWEKGHQDVLRAVAALRHGVADLPAAPVPRVLIVGQGPEGGRLLRYAAELGIADVVEVRSEVPYAEMPAIYGQASCMVLGSLPVWFWEEQFGMVLAEAVCSGLPVIASSSGAIGEVLRGHAQLFPPGDWLGLARLLASGPLAQPAGRRVHYDEAFVRELSAEAAARRLGDAYDELLGA